MQMNYLLSRRALLRCQVCAFAAPISLGQAAPPRGGTIPSRHIHLDFHTSPAIPDVGEDFHAEEFARTLADAAVNSITVFAKCHHGMAYYPTRVGTRHPHLKIDLLGEMTEACHRIGIQVSAYLSTMYDQYAWRNHGDWRVLGEDGKPAGLGGSASPLEPDLGKICINTAYIDYLVAQADEVVTTYDIDGVFYDNYGYPATGCCCPACMLEREQLGLNSLDRQQRLQHARTVMERGMARLASVVRRLKPGIRIFFNGIAGIRQDPEFLRSVLKYFTHFEIESLPGGSWGYQHFQMASRYLRDFQLDCMGQTGSFHRSWGDFGSIRNQAALDYECFVMLAQGMRCAIGDHLHPRGRLNKAVYERIGRTFRSVAEKESWCQGAHAVTEIGCLFTPGASGSQSDAGATAMLTQLQHQFDFLDPASDFRPYRLLVLPDNHRLDDALRRKLEDYVARGGKLLLSNESGLDPDGKRFALAGMELEYEGPWKHEVQYLEVLDPLARGLPGMVHVAYENGSAVKARPGATVLARIWASYFDRDFRHFQVEQTPFSKATDYVAVAASRGLVYVAIPIFRAYARFGYAFYRQLTGNAIARLLPDPLVRATLPSTAQVTVTSQPGRCIVHLLNYVPERRAPDLDIVEDVFTLVNVRIALRSDHSPREVYLAPQRRPLRFDYVDGYVTTEVPAITGHQMVVFEV